MLEFTLEPNRIHYADPQGRPLAEIEFPECAPNIVDIHRTFVDESLRGQGIADALMEAVTDMLIADGRKARTSCSYAADWMKKHPDIAHLLDPHIP